MDSDEEDFVFIGTPIEREEELTSRKKKAVAEAAGQLRSLPPWKQEVTDEEGRRRFHGAFTGGFSAGYFNTVGTKEGWTPQTFTSSRKNRAEVKQQTIFNFLDEDEKEEMQGHSLGASLQFDTFGFTAAEHARKQAEKEQQRRPSAIPGPVPDEMVLPATDSVGVKLLLKMGWRHGHSIRDSRRSSLYDARREGRKALLALSADDTKPSGVESVSDHESVAEQLDDDLRASGNTSVFVLDPKQDMHGLGYDPFKHAPEFRERKRLRVTGNKESLNRRYTSMKDNLSASKSGKMAPGFGIGALEEPDVEDEDIYASGFDFEETYVQEVEEPALMIPDNKKMLGKNEQGVLPGFKVASNSDYKTERFDPPSIPKDFEPHHKFPAALETGYNLADFPPPEVPPPEDNNMRILIEGFATLVARCGKLFEDLSKEKNKTNPLFCFLTGGNGHDYYARKLWEEQQKRKDERKQQLILKSMPNVQKMSAEVRGKILGEKPLERSSRDSSSSVVSTDVQLQFNLSDTFMKPASLNDIPESAKPFRDDPAKQERFERFLKEKYQGGLRTIDSGGSSSMSESDRARERLDFEAATETMEKAGWNKETNLSSRQQVFDLSATTGLQFTSRGMEQAKISLVEELMAKKMYPKREEFQWRPSPILCKRFDMIDPFMGKPPPAPRAKSRMETLIFTSDSVKTTTAEQSATANKDTLPVSQSKLPEKNEETNIEEADVEIHNANVERPVDLYKAIFSDDSDDEGETSSLNQVENSGGKNEVVANTTLNRLIAGDFLESLGKELGLEVPPDPSYSTNRASTSASLKESSSKSAGDFKIRPVGDTPSVPISQNGSLFVQEVAHGKSSHLDTTKDGRSDGNELVHGNRQSGDSKVTGADHPENSSDKLKMEKMVADNDRTRTGSIQHKRRSSSASSDDEKHRRHSRRHQNRSSNASSEDEKNRRHFKRRQGDTSSEDERFITQSKRKHSRNSASDSDSYEDLRNHDRSRSKEKRGSSGAKSSSGRIRKRSKHRTDRTDSPSRSHHGTKKDRAESKRDRKKSRDQGRHSGSSKSDSHRKYH
ncbi:G patch domain-containing protein TGH isoform X2 [Telopea speciosissima]|uniref:G patch domain-containing protein TGH isoform X2 n=1 Tax=Telopea speciosissima TaxID=54955 RepID=UPI001CC69382|nr:G patch domain-containing protein TGH isoform X2 [Telopea speciosissima]